MVRYLSVGEISTIIAFIVFVATFLLPNSFALILVRSLTKQPNAATWAFMQRNLGASDWPSILQTDSVSSSAVEWKVRYLSWFRLGVVSLLALAAIITPAGLYDRITPDKELSEKTFIPITDPSGFGVGSQKQDSVPWRTCSGYYDSSEEILIDIPCPGSNQSYTITVSADGNITQRWEGGAQIVGVGKSRVELYQSGLRGLASSVASFFDIKSRRVVKVLNDVVKFDVPTSVDSFVYLRNTVADDKIFPIEGLVVDANSGQVGFRNHTVPQDAALGVTWNEDLLFMEPDTACVDMGFSFEFDVPYFDFRTNFYSDTPFELVDDGGFANFDPKTTSGYPSVTQQDPNLEGLAKAHAWHVVNATMRYPSLNLSRPFTGEPDPSRSYVGRRFQGSTKTSTISATAFDGVQMNDFGYWLLRILAPDFDIFTDLGSELSNLEVLCSPWKKDHFMEMNMFPVKCGFLMGAATQVDEPISPVIEQGSKVRRKIYSCATAVKLSIKAATFSVNSSTSIAFDDLNVTSVIDKEYAQEGDQPIWAMETPKSTYAGNLAQLWGIVAPEYEKTENVSTQRSPHLYPSYFLSFVGSALNSHDKGSKYLPASDGIGRVLSAAYYMDAQGGSLGSYDSTRNGNADVRLFERFQKLSNDASSAAKLVRLLFTDVAANYFTCGRGWLSEDVIPPPYRNSTSPMTERQIQVLGYHRQVYYKWVYGIPAFITIFLLVIILPFAIVLASTGSISEVAKLLPMLSAGRLLTNNNANGVYAEPYKLWAKTYGQRQLSIQGWNWAFSSPPTAFDEDYENEKGNRSSSTASMQRDYTEVQQDEKRHQHTTSIRPQSNRQGNSDTQRPFLSEHNGY